MRDEMPLGLRISVPKSCEVRSIKGRWVQELRILDIIEDREPAATCPSLCPIPWSASGSLNALKTLQNHNVWAGLRSALAATFSFRPQQVPERRLPHF